jgi:hypothetical protein
MHFSRDGSVFLLISEFENGIMKSDPGMDESEGGPLYLREGECFNYLFNTENGLLRI